MKANDRRLLTLILCSMLTGTVSAAGSVVIDDAWVTANGSTVSGTYIGTASVPAISVTTKKPVTIQNATVSGPGNLITLSGGSNVTVSNTQGTGTNPNVKGSFKGDFILANSVANLVVKNCTIAGVYKGVYVVGFSGSTSSGQTIKILNNIFNNIDGRASDGAGGYVLVDQGKDPHAIQLNGVHGVPGIEIAWNQSIVVPFQGLINDTINIYSSSGTSASHLLVHDNFVEGLMGASPGDGAHYSGGGIITDGSSSDSVSTATAFTDIYNNQVVMTANYGLAIAAGHDNTIYNNRVVSAGALSTGAVYVMTFANGANNDSLQNQPTTVFYNNNVHDNVLGLLHKNSTGGLSRSDWWLPGQATSGNNQHFLPNVSTRPTIQDEQNEFASWQQKLTTNGITIGAQTGTGTLAIAAAAGSDAACTTASDTLYLDNSQIGLSFVVSSGNKQTVAAGGHTVALTSSQTSIAAGSGTCTSTLSAASVAVTAGQTATVTATYHYHAPVTTGTLKISSSAGSDSRCATASDTAYLDGATSGTSFVVGSGLTATLAAGTHPIALASTKTPVAAGGGQTGTCSSVLSGTSVVVTAGQTASVTATYSYIAATSMSCAVTSSIVNSTQLWNVKVDGFAEEVSLTGFPVDATGNVTINGSLVMKNNFQMNFWSDEGFATSVSSNSGTFSGKIYASTGSFSFSLNGFLTDATPVVMSTGDHPLQSMTINGVQCSVAFPVKWGA